MKWLHTDQKLHGIQDAFDDRPAKDVILAKEGMEIEI